jgi:hypothetical protein
MGTKELPREKPRADAIQARREALRRFLMRRRAAQARRDTGDSYLDETRRDTRALLPPEPLPPGRADESVLWGSPEVHPSEVAPSHANTPQNERAPSAKKAP